MNNKIKALLLAVVCCVAAGCGTASGNSQKQTTDATSFESEYASISLLCDVDFWEPPVWDDKLPDLISVVDSTAISQLVSSGKVWRLDEFLQKYKSDSHLLTSFPEDIKAELIKRDGAWYAFPSHMNSEDAREKWPPTTRYEIVTKYGNNNAIIWNKKLHRGFKDRESGVGSIREGKEYRGQR